MHMRGQYPLLLSHIFHHSEAINTSVCLRFKCELEVASLHSYTASKFI